MIASTERRLFERFPVRAPVKLNGSTSDYGSEVFLREASAQGMRFSSRRRFHRHDTVSLLANMNDGFPPMQLNGRVVRVTQAEPQLWEVGVEFHKVNLLSIRRLFRWLAPER